MIGSGDSIGRYQLVRLLGAGGFATVHLAEDPHLDDLVAIKMLSDSLAVDPDVRRRFIDEARIMRSLPAPGLIEVYDLNEHNGQPYFVMEHCAGGTLADRLESLDRPLSPEEGRELIDALAVGLSAIHRAGYVHRDLKPTNCLLRTGDQRLPATGATTWRRGDEELVIADFGLAKVVDRHATALSLAGGTPGFGAPEQFRGDGDVDQTADVYAASALVAWALTRTPPRAVTGPKDRPFELDDLDSTGPFAQELRRGLSFDRTDRHDDGTAWHRALTRAASAPRPAAAVAVPAGAAPAKAGCLTAPAQRDAPGLQDSIARKSSRSTTNKVGILILAAAAAIGAVGVAALFAVQASSGGSTDAGDIGSARGPGTAVGELVGSDTVGERTATEIVGEPAEISINIDRPQEDRAVFVVDGARLTNSAGDLEATADTELLVVDYQLYFTEPGRPTVDSFRLRSGQVEVTPASDFGLISFTVGQIDNGEMVFEVDRGQSDFVLDGGVPAGTAGGLSGSYRLVFDPEDSGRTPTTFPATSATSKRSVTAIDGAPAEIVINIGGFPGRSVVVVADVTDARTTNRHDDFFAGEGTELLVVDVEVAASPETEVLYTASWRLQASGEWYSPQNDLLAFRTALDSEASDGTATTVSLVFSVPLGFEQFMLEGGVPSGLGELASFPDTLATGQSADWVLHFG